MPGIAVGNNESIDSALRRFKKQVEKGGILSEARRREYYEKPSVKKKEKNVCCQEAFYKRAQMRVKH